MDQSPGGGQQLDENDKTAEELDQFENELNSELSALHKDEPVDEQPQHSDGQSNEDSDKSSDSEDQAESYGSDDSEQSNDEN